MKLVGFVVATGTIVAINSATIVTATEGMWLPSQTRAIARPLREAGLQLDPITLGDLNRPPLTAIVSLGGCSAAFLSPDGLIATNHHCVYGSIQYNSGPGKDYLTDGFLAASLADELPAAPGSRAYVIEDLRDVTTGVLKGTTKLGGRGRYDLIESNRKALIAECEKQPSRRCDIRPYFGGRTYFLQQQLEIKDVRLVYAPAGGIGNFGGEIDNWQWPRHTGDFGFYRAYVAPDGSSASFDKANVPFRPKAWLPVAKNGVKEGDFIMVAGFPGTTDRSRTADEAVFAFETLYPLQQRQLAEYSDAIIAATAGNRDAEIRYASILQGSDNFKKKLLGQIAGADAIGLIEKKRADEAAFRAWVATDPARKARHAPAIAALDTLIAEANKTAQAAQVSGILSRGQLYSAARLAYRWAQERAKPDAQRESGYQDRDRRQLTERLTQIEKRFEAGVDRKLFEQALADYQRLQPADRNAGFDKAIAEIGVKRLYAETSLTDTVKRVGWLDMPIAAFEASTDPFVRLAVAASPADRASESVAKARAGDVQRARAAYMDARFAWAAEQGRTLYPDANGSLRFTFGNIAGRERDGLIWKPFTTATGILEKQTGREPFDAPARTIAAIKAGDFGRYVAPELGTLPVNYLSTVDITNGNSGSSTLNARGEFVGLAFDGTLDGVISDWWFDANINRTIHVDSRYMLWTMDKIDDAQRLLREMGQTDAAQSDTLRLATWNMEWLLLPSSYDALAAACVKGQPMSNQRALPCPEPGRPPVPRRSDADLDALARQAVRLDADVVALQEVDGPAVAARVFPGYHADCFVARAHPQKTGFVIRNTIPYHCNAELAELDDDGRTRAGADVTLWPGTPYAIRLLSVHLKSGCFADRLDATVNPVCARLRAQVPVLENWVDARAREGAAYAIMGDFNRRLESDAKLPAGSDEAAPLALFAALNDNKPAGASLLRATSGAAYVGCDSNDHYDSYIDNLLISRSLAGRASARRFIRLAYDEPDSRAYKLSDHCPIGLALEGVRPPRIGFGK